MNKKNKEMVEVRLPYGMPGDVPQKNHQHYAGNYYLLTRNLNRLMLFAADHKIEHLNADFYGAGIDEQALDPEHLFKIAAAGNVGCFATHFGLISRYARNYPKINYIAKLNGKTNIIPLKDRDPFSTLLWSVDDIAACKFDAHINICGIGVTIYLGSTFEQEMLAQAAHAITRAHNYGLVAIAWVYPRGSHVPDEETPAIIAGATGVAASLGADFVKVHMPHSSAGITEMEALATACIAAKRTGVIVSGGNLVEPAQLLERISDQIKHGAVGCAVGRNIFQRSLRDAVALTKAINAIVYENKNAAEALELYKSELTDSRPS